MWSTGDTTSYLADVSSGRYKVTVTDANGCETSLSDIEVTENDDITLSSFDTTRVYCYGEEDGVLSVTVTGG